MAGKRNAQRYAAAAAIALVAMMLGGCNNGHVGLDPTGWFSSPDSRATSGTEGGFTVFQGSAEAPMLHPVTPADLVGPDGKCEGIAAEPAPASTSASTSASPSTSASAPAAASRGVGLTMTECALVAVAGAPEQVNLGTDEGSRRAVLTYTKGDHPGIYTFVSGRLKIIERVAAPPKPEPRRRRAPKKQRA